MRRSTFRAAGYRRVSMREQDDGHSLDAQENNIRQYGHARLRRLRGLYPINASLSAKRTASVPGACSVYFTTQQPGKFDVIVVDKINRFFRHLGGLLVALDRLNAWSVSFASVQSG